MKVLLVDDEEGIRTSITQYLALESIEADTARNGLSAQRILQQQCYDGVVLDVRMPGLDGLELLRWIRNHGPSVPVIMMSAFGEVPDAVEAMKLGAEDYLVKPFDPAELVLRLQRAVERCRLRNQVQAAAATAAPRDESRNERMHEVYRVIARAAPSNSTVLITGESGTGKEVLARRVHQLSPRRDNPFVPVNLAGLPESLLESELFGYERGAFTGAERRKSGLFETAQAGTLFLDEIGDLPIALQVKLLRVIQEKRIQRLGGTGSVPVDVRFVAATHRNLEKRIAEGAFREDLFYRMNVIRVDLPPLRERREDIVALAEQFLRRIALETGRNALRLSDDALEWLCEYHFPGNVRELENLIERAAILSESPELTARQFAEPNGENPRSARSPQPSGGTLRALERDAILAALHRHEGNRTRAAEELGITRRTLFNKIQGYWLSRL